MPLFKMASPWENCLFDKALESPWEALIFNYRMVKYEARAIVAVDKAKNAQHDFCVKASIYHEPSTYNITLPYKAQD